MESNKQYAKVTEFDGVPKAGELLPLAFQHVVAMIVGVSVALGSGITQAEGCLQLFPQWFVTIFGGSSVVVTSWHRLDKYIKTTYTVFHFRKEYKNLGTGQEERL